MPNSSNDPVAVQTKADHGDLAKAILQTVAYVDVFDYPLLPAEIHRYLIGMAAPQPAVEEALTNGHLVPRRLHHRDGYLTLPGRQHIVETRRQREQVARQLWRAAAFYGRLLARLPFVRMVAVTGSLAVNNADRDADIDYLVVTANDRLWLARAFTILIVRLAAGRGVQLCPNYLLSERALVFPEQNLYTAHELAQMVPLHGQQVYRRMRRLNRWTDEWLPNATTLPQRAGAQAPSRLQRLLEGGLQNGLGRRLEAWERERKLAKFSRQAAQQQADPATLEVNFSVDWCKGHFDGHGRFIMEAYSERVQSLGIE